MPVPGNMPDSFGTCRDFSRGRALPLGGPSDRVPEVEEFTEGDVPVSPGGAGPLVQREIDGELYQRYVVRCPGEPAEERWVPVGERPGDLLPGLLDRAHALIPLPAPAMNPAAEVGAIVNVGLWLAVEEQVVPSISAEAGSAWITLTPRMTIVTVWELPYESSGRGEVPALQRSVTVDYDVDEIQTVGIAN